MQLAGNWSASIAGAGGCSGVMVLTQSEVTFGGTWVCGQLQGGVYGSLAGDEVALQFSATGYEPVLVTGTAMSEKRISGFASGSGYAGETFTASR